VIRATRKRLGVTQKDLALTTGTGLRFIIDLEKGKETCELGKIAQGPANPGYHTDTDATAGRKINHGQNP
jgi:transcriptional regulator with XRE-family HTH domain